MGVHQAATHGLWGSHTLKECVERYQKLRREKGHVISETRDNLPDWCRQAPLLTVAIRRACLSIRPNGKTHHHQTRVPMKTRQVFAERLMRKRWYIDRRNDFDALHDFILGQSIHGIGPVTVYDVSVRIGAYLGLEPKSVYVHAGVTKGANALGLRITQGRVLRKDLPDEFRDMGADDVEDFLCTARDVLHGGMT